MNRETKEVKGVIGGGVDVRVTDGRCVRGPDDHDLADMESLIPYEHEYVAALIVGLSVEDFRKMHPEDRLSFWGSAARVIGEIG